MQTIPEVTGARHTGARRVWLSFADGVEGEVDLSRYLGYGPVFAPLADEEFFRQLRVEAGTIAWPNGADIAPERLYELLVGYKLHSEAPVPMVAEGGGGKGCTGVKGKW